MENQIKYSDIGFLIFDFAGTVVQYDPSTMDITYDYLNKLGLLSDHKELGDLIYKTNSMLRNTIGIDYYKSDELFWHTAISILIGKLKGNDYFLKISTKLVEILRKTREDKQFIINIDINALNTIYSSGIPMALLSNWAPTLPKYCEELGIATYFQFILASEAIGVAKPNPTAFHYAARLTGLDFSKVLYIGDNYFIDYEGALNAGLSSLLIDNKGWYKNFRCNRISNLLEALYILK